MLSTALPSSTSPVSRPTSLQTLRVTRSLSPVSTFTRDPVVLQRGDGLARRLLRRIEKRDVSLEYQLGFVGFGVGGPFVQRARGHRQNAKSVGAQIIVFLDEIADQDRLHRQDLPLAFKLGATGKNRFRRALWSGFGIHAPAFRR